MGMFNLPASVRRIMGLNTVFLAHLWDVENLENWILNSGMIVTSFTVWDAGDRRVLFQYFASSNVLTALLSIIVSLNEWIGFFFKHQYVIIKLCVITLCHHWEQSQHYLIVLVPVPPYTETTFHINSPACFHKEGVTLTTSYAKTERFSQHFPYNIPVLCFKAIQQSSQCVMECRAWVYILLLVTFCGNYTAVLKCILLKYEWL